jgi:chromosome segregation ATPase
MSEISPAESALTKQARTSNAGGWISVRANDVQTLLAIVRSLRSRLESAEQLIALKQGIIEAAETRIRELASRLDSAERDTARLDWLQASASSELRIRVIDGRTYLTRWHRRYITSHDTVGESLRECVDDFAPHSPTPTQGGTNGV